MCEKRGRIALIGIGMGSRKGMTQEVLERMEEADCLIGAARMLARGRSALGELGKSMPPLLFEEYRPEEIRDFLLSHREIQNGAVLLSGDTGFYSGAKKLYALLKDQWEVEWLPGISSVSYLAARLGVSWEDAALVSLHGTKSRFVSQIRHNEKTFLLLGGEGAAERLLDGLTEFGLDHVVLTAGTDLSSPAEELISGTARELKSEQLRGLCTVFAHNPCPSQRKEFHRGDAEFFRGNVPMTKEEVRAVSLAKLELAQGAVVYDVGAGTGSVSVEAALWDDSVTVYSVEKNPEAVRLLHQNRKWFCAEGITVVEGDAPEALLPLEPPTHVFVGGSGGRLRQIVETVKKKNPSVRIVINAISLETVKEAVELMEEGILNDAEVTQMMVSKSRTLGHYHMMMGQNPVYIISSGGKSQ